MRAMHKLLHTADLRTAMWISASPEFPTGIAIEHPEAAEIYKKQLTVWKNKADYSLHRFLVGSSLGHSVDLTLESYLMDTGRSHSSGKTCVSNHNTLPGHLAQSKERLKARKLRFLSCIIASHKPNLGTPRTVCPVVPEETDCITHKMRETEPSSLLKPEGRIWEDSSK